MKKNLKIKISGIKNEFDFFEISKFFVDIYSFDSGHIDLLKKIDDLNAAKSLKFYGSSTNNKKNSDLVLWNHLKSDSSKLDELISQYNVNIFEVTQNLISDIKEEFLFLKSIREKGVKLIYSGLDWSHDFYPASPFDTFSEQELKLFEYYQIELLTDYTDSWNFFKNECTQQNGCDLTPEDIQILSEKHPIILSLDFNLNNIFDILNYYPNIKGINLSITSENHFYEHVQTKENIIEVLKALR